MCGLCRGLGLPPRLPPKRGNNASHTKAYANAEQGAKMMQDNSRGGEHDGYISLKF